VTFVIALFGRAGMTAAFIGLILANIDEFTNNLQWFVRCSAIFESRVCNIERILDLIETPPEADLINYDNRPPINWPSEGKVQFENVSMRYRESLPLVLNKLNVTINPREKIGIVGRTGAGKSSLTMVILRLIELSEGKIIIDGVDISEIGLRDLRSKIGLIPQDPNLFSGTLRENLDPLEEYTEDEIWLSLERAHLKKFVEGLPEKLDTLVTEGGNNFSVGQKQLLCLGRTLLKNSQILILDEATASVDNETDLLIQDTIRKEFNDKTVITIAHRLYTIMDCDKIIVMDKGSIAEFDSPSKLLESEGFFFKLVQDTGKSSSEYLTKIAQKNKG